MRSPVPSRAADPHARASFGSDTLWTLAAHGTSKVAAFVFVVIIARGLAAEGYGYFNFAVSFVPLFLAPSAVGIDAVVIKQLAEDRGRLSSLFASGILIRGSLGGIALVMSLAIAPFFVRDPTAIATVGIIGLGLLVDEITNFLGAVFRGFERMALYGGAIMVNRAVSTLLALLVVGLGGGLLPVGLAYLGGSVSALVGAWILLVKRFPPVSLRDSTRAATLALLRQGLPVGIADSLNMVTLRVDAVMLQAMIGPVAVAMYGIAYRFFESFLFIVWSVATAVLPRIARMDDRDGSRTFGIGMAVVLAGYIPIAVGAPFTADWLVTAIFSDRYAEAASAVTWLTSALALYAVAHLARVSCIAVGARREVAWFAGVALAVNLAANIVMIPRFGFVGAAAATVLTEGIEALLLFGLYLRIGPGIGLRKLVVAPIAAGAVMAMTLGYAGLEGPAAMGVGSGVYVIFLVLGSYLFLRRDARAALTFALRSSSTESSS